MKIGNKEIVITNPEKVLFPKDKITKIQVCEYYAKIGTMMLPYTKNHALTMHRFPHGINEEGFYHKNAPDFFPQWIKLFSDVTKEEKVVNYVVANNVATLVYLANYGCLVPHLWLSKIDKPNYPDCIIFDLDPSNDRSFKLICKVAKELKLILEDHDLVPFVKTTGSRGLHVTVPIKKNRTFDEVRSFANKIAEILIKNDPANLTQEIRKNKRGNKIFIDTLRNSYGATAVSPYAIRAKNGAPIAAPVDWKELDDPKFSPQKYNIFNIFEKISKNGDPWHEFYKHAKSIKI